MYFFQFNGTCKLGSNYFVKFLESIMFLIPKQKVALALVLEWYLEARWATKVFKSIFEHIKSFGGRCTIVEIL
jgi:hypothetical protein